MYEVYLHNIEDETFQFEPIDPSGFTFKHLKEYLFHKGMLSFIVRQAENYEPVELEDLREFKIDIVYDAEEDEMAAMIIFDHQREYHTFPVDLEYIHDEIREYCEANELFYNEEGDRVAHYITTVYIKVDEKTFFENDIVIYDFLQDLTYEAKEIQRSAEVGAAIKQIETLRSIVEHNSKKV